MILAAILFGAAAPEALAGGKFAAVTVDARNGKILYSDNADAIRHPASLTKMMTLYVLFQDLKAGKIKLHSPIRMSARAASMAPSKLGVKAGKSITVETAIRALVVKSANDVAAAVAENLGGSEQAFAKRMTRTARSIGMSRSNFANASGLPNPNQVTTARDMATLGLRLMRDFPQYYPYFRTQSFVYNGRAIRGHNRLLGRYEGTDGIKTGYINASGFNLVTSVRRGDKRLVGVVLGGRSGGSRDAYMKKMLSQYFRSAVNGKTIAAMAGSSKGAINPAATSGEKPVATVDADTPRRPKGSIFGKKKDATAAEKNMETLVAESATIATPEEGDTDVEAAGDVTGSTPDAAKGQTIQQIEVPVGRNLPRPVQAATSAPPAAPASPTVEEAELVNPNLPEALPFEVKSPEQQQADAAQVASPEPESGWSIQIGTYSTKPDAKARLLELRKKLPQVFVGKTAQTIAVQKGKIVNYRARFVGFSEQTARAACLKISRQKSACTIQGPG
jgi:D-alanyl-D-alanine carboxypeptidase